MTGEPFEPLLLTEDQARVVLGGIGRTTFFALLKSGELRSVKINRRLFVTMDALRRYVDRLSQDDPKTGAA